MYEYILETKFHNLIQKIAWAGCQSGRTPDSQPAGTGQVASHKKHTTYWPDCMGQIASLEKYTTYWPDSTGQVASQEEHIHTHNLLGRSPVRKTQKHTHIQPTGQTALGRSPVRQTHTQPTSQTTLGMQVDSQEKH